MGLALILALLQAEGLPAGAVGRMGEAAFRQAGMSHSLSFSPDGKLVASGHEDGSILLWEVRN
jgi:WD40 repeat protein